MSANASYDNSNATVRQTFYKMIEQYLPSQDTIKTITAFVSIFIAILSFVQKQRLKQITSAHLWTLFKKQQNAYGMSQAVLRLYKEHHKDNINAEVLTWAAKCESFDQHIQEDIMAHIYLIDDKLNLTKIEQYLRENKISSYDKGLFELMINEPPVLSIKQKTLKLFGIPF